LGILTSLILGLNSDIDRCAVLITGQAALFSPDAAVFFKDLLYTKNELEINLNLVFVPFTGI
jgi:hypothetical protein